MNPTQKLIEQNLEYAAGAWRRWWQNNQIDDQTMLKHIARQIVTQCLSHWCT